MSMGREQRRGHLNEPISSAREFASRRRRQEMSDSALTAAMAAGDWYAFEEFFRRHVLLLDRECVRNRIPRSEREPRIAAFLGRLAKRLIERQDRPPEDMRSYLVRAFRNQSGNERRAGERERERRRFAGQAEGLHAEGVIGPSVSQFSRECSSNPLDEPEAAPDVVRKLAAFMDSQLSEDDRRLLVLLAEKWTMEEIGKELGITEDAAKKRVRRRRARLKRLCARHSSAFDAVVRRRLECLLGDLETCGRPPDVVASVGEAEIDHDESPPASDRSDQTSEHEES